METFKADLKEANIEFINAKNQRADFHSLRHTLATNLALSGTAPRVAMEIMRHSDMRLTSKTYTDAGLLPIIEAVAKLPSFTDSSVKNSQIDSQNSIRMGQVLSVPVEKITNRDELKTTDKQRLMSLQSTSVMTRQEREEWCAMQAGNQRFFMISKRCQICGSTPLRVRANIDTGRKFCKRCSQKRRRIAQRHFASDGKISKVVGKHLLRISPD